MLMCLIFALALDQEYNFAFTLTRQLLLITLTQALNAITLNLYCHLNIALGHSNSSPHHPPIPYGQGGTSWYQRQSIIRWRRWIFFILFSRQYKPEATNDEWQQHNLWDCRQDWIRNDYYHYSADNWHHFSLTLCKKWMWFSHHWCTCITTLFNLNQIQHVILYSNCRRNDSYFKTVSKKS